MNIRAAVHAHWPSRIRELNVRRLLAGAAVLALAAIGLIAAARAAYPFKFEAILFALAVTTVPAAVYAFGYFRIFPDVLDAGIATQTKPLSQRWSDFARWVTVVAVIITWVCWSKVIVTHFRGIVLSLNQMPSMIDIFVFGQLTTRPDLCVIGALVSAALMTMCLAATEQYLARSFGSVVPHSSGWRDFAPRCIAACGSRLCRWLRPKAALLIATALLLLSLIAPMDIFDGFGYQVISGKQGWPTAEYTLTGPLLAIFSQIGRATYIAAFVIGLLGLIAVLIGRRGDRLRRSSMLAIASIIIALFAACDLALGVARLDSTVPLPVNSIAQALVWIVPIALWLWRGDHTRSDHTRSDRTHLAVMILYLPIVFAAFGLLPLVLILVPSYAFYFLACFFLAWGFTRSRWDMPPGPA